MVRPRRYFFCVDKSTFVPVPSQMETINEEIRPHVSWLRSSSFHRPPAARTEWLRQLSGKPNRYPCRGRLCRSFPCFGPRPHQGPAPFFYEVKSGIANPKNSSANAVEPWFAPGFYFFPEFNA